MELMKGNIYVYCETPINNGKWILAKISVNTKGVVQVYPQNENKLEYQLSSNWIIEAPNDAMWHKIPPLPYRRSVKELFGLHEKKGKTVWFLAMSEQNRSNWFTTLAQYTKRKPLPYGDYDNWSYPSDEPDVQRRCSTSFAAPHSFVPQHRSGFYSVQKSQKVSKLADVPLVTPVLTEQLPKKTEKKETVCCKCCSGIVACLCTSLAVCCQQMCLSISAVIN